jgi:hypothetical protein
MLLPRAGLLFAAGPSSGSAWLLSMEMTVSNRKALLLGICIAIAISTLINAVLWVSEANAHIESKFEPASLEITKHRLFL